MYCLSACHVLLYMILYQQTSVVYLQTLTLTIETSPLVRGEDVTLKCLYSGPTCCTDDARVWTRDGTEIMNNGAPSDITKYKEERNDASLHFDMKILNLDDDDFSKAFQCQYNFKTSNTVTLSKNESTYESPPTESCSFAYNPAGTMIEITGTLNITKAAPSPVLTAYYGEDNLTPYLSSTGVSNYDTWYYTLTVSTDIRIHCRGHLNDKFKLYAITGTTSTEICVINMCECLDCFPICSFSNWSFGILGIIISMVYCCIYCGEEYEKPKLRKMAVLYGILTVIPSLIVGLTMGLYGCICNEGYFWLFAFGISIVCRCIDIVIIDRIIYKIAWRDFKDNKIKLVIGLLGGIAIFMIHDNLKKGGKSQSVESGSSCWPICRVGQDPNTSSSDPEKVRRSPEKERADKKKDRKPTEVVRPQPTRPLPPMHLKTDNTGRAEYSTETEIFKPHALPSINKASDSPRPLPQKPPGTQLDPLSDSTSEKKKKKKRKKKEPKQSDEEN